MFIYCKRHKQIGKKKYCACNPMCVFGCAGTRQHILILMPQLLYWQTSSHILQSSEPTFSIFAHRRMSLVPDLTLFTCLSHYWRLGLAAIFTENRRPTLSGTVREAVAMTMTFCHFPRSSLWDQHRSDKMAILELIWKLWFVCGYGQFMPWVWVCQ